MTGLYGEEGVGRILCDGYIRDTRPQSGAFLWTQNRVRTTTAAIHRKATHPNEPR